MLKKDISSSAPSAILLFCCHSVLTSPYVVSPPSPSLAQLHTISNIIVLLTSHSLVSSWPPLNAIPTQRCNAISTQRCNAISTQRCNTTQRCNAISTQRCNAINTLSEYISESRKDELKWKWRESFIPLSLYLAAAYKRLKCHKITICLRV